MVGAWLDADGRGKGEIGREFDKLVCLANGAFIATVIGVCAANIAAIVALLTVLGTRNTDLVNRFDHVEARVNERFDSIETRLDAITETLSASARAFASSSSATSVRRQRAPLNRGGRLPIPTAASTVSRRGRAGVGSEGAQARSARPPQVVGRLDRVRHQAWRRDRPGLDLLLWAGHTSRRR